MQSYRVFDTTFNIHYDDAVLHAEDSMKKGESQGRKIIGPDAVEN